MIRASIAFAAALLSGAAGQWVAADLAKTRTLKELAEMNGEPLRAEIEASLRRMADCAI